MLSHSLWDSVVIDFLVAIATIPNKNNLGEDRVILAHNLKEDSLSE